MKILIGLIVSFASISVFSQCEVPFPDNYETLSKQLIEKLNKEGIPSFDFINENGEKFSIQSMEGKLIAINYWSFTCKPCIEEMPKLNRLVEKFGEKANFLSILPPGNYNIQSQNLQKKIESFSFKYHSVAMSECFADIFEVPMIFPTHIIIGKDGRILDLFFGTDVSRLEKLLINNI
ncbi:TlpA disulfide reductase family protein [Ekhidna sp.]|uniref:TlpA family protein disulfide reductase n=1 Tax=Ekhidna sp. TaxID=2608089 RepID=UPI003299D362